MDSKGKTETLKEQVDAIAREPVSTAVNNMQNEYLQIAKRLRALPLNVAGSVLQQLSTEFQLRQEETKNAIEEHKFHLAVKLRQEQDEAAKKLAAEQQEIEEANRPRLVPAGQAPN
jgi:membrane protein involved in colicin uptake